jgi:murein hydrolase activator
MIRAALIVMLAAWPAAADPVADAQRAAEQLRSAGVAYAEAGRARDRVRALTDTIRGYEQGLAVLRDALRDAALRERAIRQRFERGGDRLSRVLAALQTMSRSPEATVLLHPAGGIGTARAAMLMSEAAPALSAEAARLRAELQELEDLSLLRRTAVATLEEGLLAAQEARAALAQAMSERQSVPANPVDDAILLALVNGSETLDAFASSLTSTEAEQVGSDGFAEARGKLPLPVAGVLLSGYREADAAGVARPGLLLATEPQALVTSPWPGTIRYAGPLLDYGNVLILEPEAGYLLILAGLGGLFGGAGTVVQQGDPLGLMAGQEQPVQGNLIATDQGGGRDRPQTLYIELRRDGGPDDPAPWFTLGKE